MSLRWKTLMWVLALVVMIQSTDLPVMAEDDSKQTSSPGELLILGPLPLPPEGEETAFPRGEHQVIQEIDPGKNMPDIEQSISVVPGQNLKWKAQQCDNEGGLKTSDKGVYWVSTVFYLASGSKVEFHLSKGTNLFCNGEELTGEDIEGELVAETRLTAGWVVLYGRSVDGSGLSVQWSGKSILPKWTLNPLRALTRFDDFASQPRVGSLVLSDDGKILARKLSRRNPELSRLDIMDNNGHVLASDLSGGKATAVGFLPGSHDLLVRRGSTEGTNLQVWTAPMGPWRTVLPDEPGLGFVKISPSGRHLLFSSTAAFEEAEPEEGNRRFVHLRERVTDFTPVPHLHLLDLETGSRRLLTTPADKVLDDAVFAADGQSVFYGQTVNQVERPWFFSEIRQLNLVSGEDKILAKFTGGWEVRPHGFAASADGKSLVFLGPPEEVGSGHAEHNVYNKQLWRLDVSSGDFERITQGSPLAFDGGGNMPQFDNKGRLLVTATSGSVNRVAQLDPKKDWKLTLLDLPGESIAQVTASTNGQNFLYTASKTSEPGVLYRADANGKSREIEKFSAQWSEHWQWSEPESATFTADDGTEIDAWFYPPLMTGTNAEPSFGAPEDGQSPLIVYYYAGAVPTMRGFNGTHQFFAANGYGVLVVNPRGAYGYGDAYADHHAGDWGPQAASDIIAGTRKILHKHSWLNEDAIGIYGGSYGGFMTEYLVTATDMFASAVSMYGISDLSSYWGQGAWGWTYGDMALAGKTPWADPDYFIEHSPLFRADKINTPLLLLHGSDDRNVTPGESEQLFTAMSVLNRPVEMVLFPGEGHGISGSWENRVAHRTMILEWFDQYCREDDTAWTERWK